MSNISCSSEKIDQEKGIQKPSVNESEKEVLKVSAAVAGDNSDKEPGPMHAFGSGFKPMSFSQLKASSSKSSSLWQKDAQKDDIEEKQDSKLILTKSVTGEEEELILYSANAKLYVIDKKNTEWVEKGAGAVKTNADSNGMKRIGILNYLHLVMRSEGVLKVILNVRVSDMISPKKHPSLDTAVVFGYFDGTSQLSYMIRVYT
jgi:hypothetical protein